MVHYRFFQLFLIQLSARVLFQKVLVRSKPDTKCYCSECHYHVCKKLYKEKTFKMHNQ
jgi:hypothetical protein